MTTDTARGPRSSTRSILARFAQIGFLILIQAAALFVSAGRLNWREAWVYLAVYVGFIGLNAVILLPHDTGLIEERGRIAVGTNRSDRWVLALIGIAGPVMLIVAGLDERFGWSPAFALAIQAAALLYMILGLGLFAWAMAANRFFSVAVRVQHDRSQRVVTGGPYQYVRHPGYLGTIVFSLAAPLMLTS